MRIRTVKPEFWKHPVLTKIDPMARLLAIGILNYADDDGYFYADPDAVRGDILFREDSKNVLGWLKELSKVGYIELCESPERGTIGRVINFTKHQRVDKPRASDIAPFWDSENVLGTIQDQSTTPPAGKERKGMEGRESIGMENNIVPAEPRPCEVVFNHWRSVTGHSKAILDPKRTKLINTALKLGYTVEQLKTAIDGNKASPFHQGDNDRKTVYDGLDLILRDAAQIDKFIALSDGRGTSQYKGSFQELDDHVNAQLERLGLVEKVVQ